LWIEDRDKMRFTPRYIYIYIHIGYTKRCYIDDKKVDKTQEVAVTGSTFVVPRNCHG